jgi:hypothetical protein
MKSRELQLTAFDAGPILVSVCSVTEAGIELTPERRSKRGRMKSILDPAFRYTPSVQTDIRKTFARIRRQQREAGSKDVRHIDEAQHKVLAIVPRRGSAQASSR